MPGLDTLILTAWPEQLITVALVPAPITEIFFPITNGAAHVAAPGGTLTVSPELALEIAAEMSANEALAAILIAPWTWVQRNKSEIGTTWPRSGLNFTHLMRKVEAVSVP